MHNYNMRLADMSAAIFDVHGAMANAVKGTLTIQLGNEETFKYTELYVFHDCETFEAASAAKKKHTKSGVFLNGGSYRDKKVDPNGLLQYLKGIMPAKLWMGVSDDVTDGGIDMASIYVKFGHHELDDGDDAGIRVRTNFTFDIYGLEVDEAFTQEKKKVDALLKAMHDFGNRYRDVVEEYGRLVRDGVITELEEDEDEDEDEEEDDEDEEEEDDE